MSFWHIYLGIYGGGYTSGITLGAVALSSSLRYAVSLSTVRLRHDVSVTSALCTDVTLSVTGDSNE